MDEERFKVVFFDKDGYWSGVRNDLPAKEAVEVAKAMVDLALTADSDIARVLIADSGDDTAFLWERDKGIVFPRWDEEQRRFIA